ncbi:MAG: Hsp20/alpha crystallin family protein [Muribaculaceae bacterium]|nr:Hsp20/alpha crystallin family protein [Muribaculaceae bacterium]MBQ6279562.1 Hsp20/alpha crystallin family protein [Muribaculaceae bacterium]
MLLARRNSNWLPDVFNDFFDTDFLPKVNSNTTAPAINVIEKKDEYDVELAAPGMTKEDFKVSLDEDCNLVVELDKKVEKTEENKETGHYLRREFSYTKFHQTLLLPDDVNRDNISATVENGVLKVVLPKLQPQEMKKERTMIEIQ